MSAIIHFAIVVSSWNIERMHAAHKKANALRLIVTGMMDSEVNGYKTFVVTTNASKEGWEDASRYEANRAEFKAWLRAQAYPVEHGEPEDEGSCFEWFEVAYGNDHFMQGKSGAEITEHGNDKRNKVA